MNYNVQVECTYHLDEVFNEDDKIDENEKAFIRNVIYRQELLNIFDMNEFNEDIVISQLELLYEKLVQWPSFQPILKAIIKKFPDFEDEDTPMNACILLFSFDFMFQTHLCICEYLKTGKLSDENLSTLNSLISSY
jgi:hypothetical protein